MRATAQHYDGRTSPRAVELAEEVPVELAYATIPHAVMMATPANLEDFARGFSLTEGIVADAAEIRTIAITHAPRGITLDIALAPAALHRHLARQRSMTGRSMAGRTGCGLCGIERLDQLPQARAVAPAAPIAPAAIPRALAGLAAFQPLHRATGAVHAAAWCGPDGAIRRLREDVGRHNALDKLIGACLAADQAPDDGFVLLTSRCSYELVEKTAAFGATTLVALAAPTTLAVARAAALGITLLAPARADFALRFTPEAAP
jgi:FdhD protein